LRGDVLDDGKVHPKLVAELEANVIQPHLVGGVLGGPANVRGGVRLAHPELEGFLVDEGLVVGVVQLKLRGGGLTGLQ
jgi:hypothetical protein